MRLSAGVLLYRTAEGETEVLLVHPGGPYWKNRDDGAWSVPKGMTEKDEKPLAAARREFREETGFDVDGEFIDLGSIRQPSRKIIHVFAVRGDVDASLVASNTFELEWPPRSGQLVRFPEIDRAAWFDVASARLKIIEGQRRFIDRLVEAIGRPRLLEG